MGQTSVALFPTACKTCRRRGRKCDRELPTCRSCKDRGAVCEGYVTRWVGVAARGKLAGEPSPSGRNKAAQRSPRSRSSVSQSPESAGTCGGLPFEVISTHSGTSSPRSDTHASWMPYKQTRDKGDSPRSESHASGPVGLSILRGGAYAVSINEMPPSDSLQGLINYYDRELSTVFYLGYGPADSPYAYHILPMAEQMLPIRFAVAATASCHAANRLSSDHLRRQSLRLRVKATELLRQRLSGGSQAADLVSLASIMLLAQLDMCSGECAELETHLKAATALVKLRGSDGTGRGYFEQRITWLDIMGATTGSRMPLLSSAEVKASLDKFRTAQSREWGFDVFCCPIDLFEYIADITMLYKLQRKSERPGQDVLDKAMRLGNSVSYWRSSHDTTGPRVHATEAWRSAILLYLVRLFQLPEAVFDVPALLSSLFDNAMALPPKTSWSYSLLWPLFQAGLSLPRDDYKRKLWLRHELNTHFQALGCCQTNHAVHALEQAWAKNSDQDYNSITLGVEYHRLMLM